MSLFHDQLTVHILKAMGTTSLVDKDMCSDEHHACTTELISRYPDYAVPDEHVLESLLFYSPLCVHRIIDEIRVGHQRLTPANVVSEFEKIGVTVPLGTDLSTLNDPVYHFCECVKKLKTFRMPTADDYCFAKSATADSNNDPAPYVGCLLMGSECRKWNKSGIGILEDQNIVTGVGHLKVKNDCIVFDPLADRNRDAANSWVRQCKSLFDQSLVVLNEREGFSVGMSYDCSSQQHKKRDNNGDASKSTTGKDLLQISWGDHESWNNMLQVSEMAGCLHKIAVGGDFLLKVRIFRRPETQFTVAVLANFFENMEIVANPKQRACFVIVYFTGKKHLSPDELTQATNYFLCNCADSTLEVFTPPDFCRPSPIALEKVAHAALQMKCYRDDSFHYFATAVRALKKNKHVINAFVNAGTRLSGIDIQINLTNDLRKAVYPHQKGKHMGDSYVWLKFLEDVG